MFLHFFLYARYLTLFECSGVSTAAARFGCAQHHIRALRFEDLGQWARAWAALFPAVDGIMPGVTADLRAEVRGRCN